MITLTLDYMHYTGGLTLHDVSAVKGVVYPGTDGAGRVGWEAYNKLPSSNMVMGCHRFGRECVGIVTVSCSDISNSCTHWFDFKHQTKTRQIRSRPLLLGGWVEVMAVSQGVDNSSRSKNNWFVLDGMLFYGELFYLAAYMWLKHVFVNCPRYVLGMNWSPPMLIN